jgi:hypothetical protein
LNPFGNISLEYTELVRQDRDIAMQAEAHSTTAFHVERANDDVTNAKNHALQYKSYRDNEQREVDAIQHQINAIKAGIDGDQGWDEDDEMEKLQQDLFFGGQTSHLSTAVPRYLF